MFISLEGPDGSGKTTQHAMLADCLRERGYKVVATREPGGTVIGDQIREVLFKLDNVKMNPRTEILLFQASRAQIVSEVIRPSLEAGKVVVCDRYADSTMAYQGYGHQVDLQELQAIIHFATGGLKPDLTLFLDIEVEAGLRRNAEGGKWNRLDDYELAFHQRAYAGYQEMIAAEPQRWLTVNAERPADEVQADLQRAVLERLRAG